MPERLTKEERSRNMSMVHRGHQAGTYCQAISS